MTKPNQQTHPTHSAALNAVLHSLAQGISGGVRYNHDQLAMANERIANLEQCIKRSLLMCYDAMGIPTVQQEGRDE